MRTGARVAIAVVIALAGACFVADSPAEAGGSTWMLDRESYEPGDVATGWASVSWEHNPDLGTPEDGPYFAFVAPVGPGFGFGAAATIPDGALRVAEIQIHLEPYDAGGLKFGPHHATLDFTVPDLAPGMYEVWHCNDPCTTTLGDLTWGTFWIGPVGDPVPISPTPPAPVNAVETPTTAAVPSSPTASATISSHAPPRPSSGLPFVAGGLGLGLAVAGGTTALLVRKRRDPE
jgi:hypothetical protein